MTTGKDIITEAKTWVGTPYAHRGRTKGFACDCIGLVLGTFATLGIKHGFDDSPYGKLPGWKLRDNLRLHTDEIWSTEGSEKAPLHLMQDGDIISCAWVKLPQHSAFVYKSPKLGCWYMIHAFEQSMQVVEHRLDENWHKKVKGIYRVRGLST